MARKTSHEKEMQVLRCLEMGLTLEKTSKATSVSITTVSRIRDRMGARNDAPLEKKGGISRKAWKDWDRFTAGTRRRNEQS